MKTFPKKLLTMLLAASMVFGLSGMTTFAAEESGAQDVSAKARSDEDGGVLPLADESSLPTSGEIPGGEYTLTDDVTADGGLTVASGTEVVIDLNGHVLTLYDGRSTYGITVNGTLTIRDTSDMGAGYITREASNYPAIRTDGSSILNLESGGIKNITNTASNAYYGVVYISSRGTFNMSGGTISGNACPNASAGSIRVWGNNNTNGAATFNMSGGTISGNTAGGQGGAIYAHSGSSNVSQGGNVNITGGTITGNVAAGEGGGIYSEYGNVTISGTGVVYGNTSETAGADIYKAGGTSYTTTIRDQTEDGLELDGHAIDGWYLDSANARWSAEDPTEKYTDTTITSMNVGLVAAYDGRLSGRSGLQEEYEEDILLKEADYTPQSWAPFAEALAAAAAVLADPTATDQEADEALDALRSAKAGLREEDPAYNVKYAVAIYGIQQDTDASGNEVGLTFGPATGEDNVYLHDYKAHLTQEEYESGEKGVCLHWMSWREIIRQSRADPTAFEECLENGCTHSVELALNDSLLATSYAGQMDDGDGAGVLTESILEDKRRWAESQTPRVMWGDSLLCSMLNDGEASLLTCFPEELQSGIVAKDVKSYNPSGSGSTQTTYDKLWLFSVWENNWAQQYCYNTEGVRYTKPAAEGAAAYQNYNEAGEQATWASRTQGDNNGNSTTGYTICCFIRNDASQSTNRTIASYTAAVGIAPGFCLAGSEAGAQPEAFAVYSEKDGSLTFYTDYSVPEAGSKYDGKRVTSVYEDVDEMKAASSDEIPWSVDSGDTTSVVIDKTFADAQPASLAYWFSGFENATFEGLENIDTSKVTSMCSMFDGCAALTDIDVSGFDVSNVTDMAGMFYNCAALESLDVSSWDTTAVTSCDSFARGCEALQWVKIGEKSDLFTKGQLVDQQDWYDSPTNGTLVSSNYLTDVEEPGQYWSSTTYDKPIMRDVTVTATGLDENNSKTYDGAGVVLTASATVEPSRAELTYQWYKVAENGAETLLDGDGNVFTTGSNVSDSGTYRCVVTAEISEGEASASAEIEITIKKATQTIVFEKESIEKTSNEGPFTNDLSGESVIYGALSYESSEPGVATVDENGLVTIRGVGKTTITATAAGSDEGNYDAVSESYTLTVAAVDKTALQAEYDEDSQLIETDYTKESWGPFEEALKVADGILTGDTATQDDVNTALDNLQSAKKNLQAVTADKDELEAAIQETDDLIASDYTEESWAKLQEALSAAEEAEADADALQSAVDAAAQDLQDALDDLQAKTADKGALEDEITAAEDAMGDMDPSDYTDESWTALEEALEAAKTIDGESDVLQSAVDAATQDLKDALDDLQAKTVDKTALEDEISAVEDAMSGLIPSDYTDESWTALEEALEAAKTIDEESDVLQSAVNAATQYLKDALGALEVAPADKDALNAVIDAVETFKDSKNPDDYAADSWNDFVTALEDAQAVSDKPDAKQSEVNAAELALLDALAGLKPVQPVDQSVDKDVLNAAITAAEALKESSYTTDSWKALQTALDAAKDAAANDEATQSEVNDATVALVDAIAALESSSEPGTGGSTKNGLYRITAGKEWGYFVNGEVDTSYTGFQTNANGTWYVENGYIHFDKNSVYKDMKGEIGTKGDWYYVVGNKVQYGFTGLANYKNANGWWYIKSGKVDFTHNSVDKNKNGWWYVTGGKVQFGFTGLANYKNANGWWYIKGGKVDFTHNGVDKNKNGWWYVTGGKVQFGYTGVANYKNANGWWYIKGGKVDFTYTGRASNKNGTWNVVNGKVVF